MILRCSRNKSKIIKAGHGIHLWSVVKNTRQRYSYYGQDNVKDMGVIIRRMITSQINRDTHYKPYTAEGYYLKFYVHNNFGFVI